MTQTYGDGGKGLAARLRAARDTAGLSTRALSHRAGLSESMVALIERGKDVRASSIAKLAVTLGVTMDWLYCGVGDRPSSRRIRAASERAAEG